VSLTQAYHAYAAVSEQGINTFLKALLTARPHYINYGSSAFVPSTTVAATNIDPIAFPGVPGGVQWAVSFTIPVLDLHPPNPKSKLKPGPNQFALNTTATVQIGGATWVSTKGSKRGTVVPVATVLDMWALGEVVSQYSGPGTGSISLRAEQVLLPDVKPPSLEQVLDELLRMLLTGALEDVNIPLKAVDAGAFRLILQQGPEISGDQVKVWGDVV
jgi:hypothetical protein